MKKLLTTTAIVTLLAFTADKFITIKFTESQINYHWNSLNQIKSLIDKSELPHNQVVYITKSIDSLQHDIQLSAKIDSTSKK
jgi:hypothetical protein